MAELPLQSNLAIPPAAFDVLNATVLQAPAASLNVSWDPRDVLLIHFWAEGTGFPLLTFNNDAGTVYEYFGFIHQFASQGAAPTTSGWSETYLGYIDLSLFGSFAFGGHTFGVLQILDSIVAPQVSKILRADYNNHADLLGAIGFRVSLTANYTPGGTLPTRARLSSLQLNLASGSLLPGTRFLVLGRNI